MNYTIYCDGSCRANGQSQSVGAWGYIILDEAESIIHSDKGSETNTTNQRMELTACIKACQYLHKQLNPFDEVHIYTDSAYLHNCLVQKWYINWQSNGWKNVKKQPVANQSLWMDLIPYFDDIHYNFHKVKGHAGVKWNEYVDNMVQSLSQKYKK